jgi:hypothetical protein
MSSHTSRSIELSSPPLGRLYELDGRHLLLHRSGSGEPPVVFLPGAGMVGLDFLNIHSQGRPAP